MIERVGILAIQGDVEAHRRMLEGLGVDVLDVLSEADLDAVDALVIPGGESTTIAKGIERLLDDADLRQRLGSHGRESAAQRFSRQAHLDGLEQALTGAVG